MSFFHIFIFYLYVYLLYIYFVRLFKEPRDMTFLATIPLIEWGNIKECLVWNRALFFRKWALFVWG